MKYLFLLMAGLFLHAVSYAQGCSANYVDPSFQLQTANPDCNPTSGRIDVINPSDGVPPYSYRLINTGQTNSTGVFTGLAAGTYSIELKDACGTVRTRQATLVPYQFSFTFQVTKINDGSCHRVQVDITASNPSMVSQYGVFSSGDNDTTWSNASGFIVNNIGRTASILVKDICGNVYTQSWTAPQDVHGYISELQYRLQCDKVDIYPVYWGFTSPTVCLYDFATKALIQCKSATGAYTGGALTNFFNVPYGKPYYVIVQDACSRDSAYFPDKTSAGGSQVDPYNWDCNTFTMHVDGPPPPASWYALHPEVDGSPDSICLYDLTRNIKVGCKPQNDHLNWISPRTGIPWESGAVWDNLPYGRYRAYIFDPCTDSTIMVDSTVYYPFQFSSQLAAHCSVTQTAVQAWFDPGAKHPFNVKVFYPDNSLAVDYVTNNAYSYVLYNTWAQAGTLTIISSDACNHSDTSYILQPLIYPTRQVRVQGGCPGLNGVSGGGDIILAGNHAAYSMSSVTIIKRDETPTVINKSYSAYNGATDRDEFYFSNLPTGRYIVESAVGCSGMKFYDTVEIKPYAYPVQIADRIYQCANNPYTFKDSTTNGVRQFTYEVVTTSPLHPPLLNGPQASDVFNIPAGASLDYITIKVVDACFNSDTKTFPVQKLFDCNTLAVTPNTKPLTVANKLVTVYPNPSGGAFTVSISQKKKANYRIEVVNASGIRVYEKVLYNVDKKDLTINERLLPGLYIVKVTDLQTEKTTVFKEIVN